MKFENNKPEEESSEDKLRSELEDLETKRQGSVFRASRMTDPIELSKQISLTQDIEGKIEDLKNKLKEVAVEKDLL